MKRKNGEPRKDSQEKKRKVFTLGLDGATFDVILPLVEKGELPNFAKIIKGGAWGELSSTVPPFSGPAWTSFQTGKDPGSHGIFDFINKKLNSYDTYYINSTHIRGDRLWDILGDSGFKVGVINVMVTYPPHPVNGFLLTGGLTPSGRNFAYPEALEKEINSTFGGYRMWDVGGISLTEGGEDKFVKAYFANEKRRMAIARHLMQTKEWDFFMVMLEGADPLQHELWKYIDESHPRFSSNAGEAIKKAIPDFYKEADRFLGDTMKTLPKDTTVCLMSDHGFGPLHRYLLVNNFLMETGVLKLKASPLAGIKKLVFNSGVTLERLNNLSRKLGLNRAAKLFRGGSGERMLSNLVPSYKDIDWGKTKAFAVGTGGHVYLNVKGREPKGIVKPGKDYERVRDLIIDGLNSLTDPKTGEKAIEKVFRKEELYQGRFLDRAPDISFLPARGYGTLHKEQFISPSVFIDSPNCGTHRINGIVMMWGPEIEGGKRIKGAKISDLTPTILHLFGLPIPGDMDGKVLKSVFRAGSKPSAAEIRIKEADEKQKARDRIKRLKNLGKI